MDRFQRAPQFLKRRFVVSLMGIDLGKPNNGIDIRRCRKSRNRGIRLFRAAKRVIHQGKPLILCQAQRALGCEQGAARPPFFSHHALRICRSRHARLGRW